MIEGIAESLSPPIASTWVCVIDPRAASWPAVSLVFISILVFDVESFLLSNLVYIVPVISLDMRIHNGDHLSAFSSEGVEHLCRCGEISRIPSEVFLAVSVFDIEPDNITRNVMSVETSIHFKNFRLVSVIPSGLMMGYREQGRNRGGTSKSCVLTEDVLWLGSKEEKDINISRFTHPVSMDVITALAKAEETFSSRLNVNINPSFRRVKPEKTSSSLGAVREHEWNTSIESHRVIKLILKHIKVVESVRIGFNFLALDGCRKSKASGVLWDTINVLC
mmetsp:Transcript_4957/g.6952  ORF Transcript_4957/g.6952 Transcript_4957/m.6952 type:complete len:278 (-) Transcript_4957:766-1599(-)